MQTRREWWSPADLAGVGGLSLHPRRVRSRAMREGWASRGRITGKGLEYHIDSLPAGVQAVLRAQPMSGSEASEPAAAEQASLPLSPPELDPPSGGAFSSDTSAPQPAPEVDLWAWAETQTEARRAIGAARARLVAQVHLLMAESELPRDRAVATVATVAADAGVSAGSLRTWYTRTRKVPREDWPAILIPKQRGPQAGTLRKEIEPAAWDWFLSQYLTRRQPTVAEVYRRLAEIAPRNGWVIADERTFDRRVSEISLPTRVYHREGAAALARLIPRQRRDVRVYAPGEAVNGDGLKLDRLWIRWPDGEIINTTTLWPWQDLRTGRILAHRIAKTENTDLFRLATFDLLGTCAPSIAWVDNTTVAANLAMTGRANGRHRFHHERRANDPVGLLIQLGIEPRFTDPDREHATPGSKRIERAFGIGGLHGEIANNPRLVDRGYSRETAVDYAEVAEVVAEEVARFNARTGRRSPECGGVKSYDQLWAELAPASVQRRVSEAQRRLLLLMVEPVRADSTSGEIRLKAGTSHLGAARYWAEWLPEVKGQRLAAYYDPEHLDRPITLYTMDGRRLGDAERLADAGHNDAQAAREVRKFRKRQQKAWKQIAEAEVRIDATRAAEGYRPDTGAAEVPPPGVVKGHFTQRRVVLEDGTLVDAESGELLDEGAPKNPTAGDQATYAASVACLAEQRLRRRTAEE